MKYRRFGKTELQMPVFSVGGMRYQHKWSDMDLNEIPPEDQANLEACIHRAMDLGMNHIETARGYGTSEMQLGLVLPKLPRDKIIVQTKVGPSEDPKQFLENFEKSMGYLNLDYVDLLAFHGVNTDELVDWIIRPGGCMEVARQLQKEGRVRFIGFSTHGTTRSILNAVNTGEFDYFNVHWYYVNPLNWPCIEAAKKLDMGVFIISPNDKGGILYRPPSKLVELCKPLTPMQFNDLFCLSHPEVHTLSLGCSRPSDFDEHVEGLKYYECMKEMLPPILDRLQAEMERTLGKEWNERWAEGPPEHIDVPGGINISEIVRLWTYAKAFDLVEWGKMRYNMLGTSGHWQPGQNAAEFDESIAPSLSESPFADRIPGILREAHEMLAGEEQKRLSES